MSYIEAFSRGKQHRHPEFNEDSFVVMPERGYAVIDGVTDRNGTRYQGMLAGQFAARTAQATIEQFLIDRSSGRAEYEGPVALVSRLTEAIAEGYRAKGVYAEAQREPSIRAGCAVAMAIVDGADIELVLVGDSGIRINGTTVLRDSKSLDDVTARLRSEAWHYFADAGVSKENRERWSRSVTWLGTRNQPPYPAGADPAAVASIAERAMAVNLAALPEIPEWEIRELVEGGISFGQSAFQNATDRALGYAVVDGFAVPDSFILSKRLPLDDVHSVELFSDGYFLPGDGFGVAAWEDAFARVEQEDPDKVGRHMSTKGTTADAMTDDRTYIGVKLK